MLVATSAISSSRLAAISGGGTVAVNAASYAAAADLAWLAADSACMAVVFIHCTYGKAAAAIDIDAEPNHGPPVSSKIADWYEPAAELIAAASPSQADAATTNGPEPAPIYIRPELTSGGNAPKFTSITSSLTGPGHKHRPK
jgi:hypothetical protein